MLVRADCSQSNIREDIAEGFRVVLDFGFTSIFIGMLAMETMGRRINDDHRNYVKYAQNPPYGDDVKWLFKIAKKLGCRYSIYWC